MDLAGRKVSPLPGLSMMNCPSSSICIGWTCANSNAGKVPVASSGDASCRKQGEPSSVYTSETTTNIPYLARVETEAENAGDRSPRLLLRSLRTRDSSDQIARCVAQLLWLTLRGAQRGSSDMQRKSAQSTQSLRNPRGIKSFSPFLSPSPSAAAGPLKSLLS